MKRLLLFFALVFPVNAYAGLYTLNYTTIVFTSPSVLQDAIDVFCENYNTVVSAATGERWVLSDCASTPVATKVWPIGISTVTNLQSSLNAKFDNPSGSSSQCVKGDGTIGACGSTPSFSIGTPNSRSMSLSTAYQCTDNTKPCSFIITTNCPITGFGGTTTCAGEIRIGSSNTVASGASGTVISPLSRSFTGLSALLTFGNSDNDTTTVYLPTGWYLAVRQITGTSLSVQAAYDQSMGL